MLLTRGGVRSTSLPESELWTKLKTYYSENAVKCWLNDEVPSYVSANGYIAAKYAKVIVDFATFHSGERIYVLDIGAGSGQLGFQVISRILELQAYVQTPFVYIMTDINRVSIEYWRNHRKLQEFIKMGILDFAVFEISFTEKLPSGVFLECAETMVTFGDRPMACVCNYVFDSLIQDAFQVKNSRLLRARLEILPEDFIFTYDVCEQLEITSCEMLPNGSVESQAALAETIRAMIDTKDKSFLVPLGAINFMSFLIEKNPKTMFLIGDKGVHDENQLLGIHDPDIASHGTVSFMLNFHFIELFITKMFPCKVVQSKYQQGFNIMGIVPNLKLANSMEHLVRWFDPGQISFVESLLQSENHMTLENLISWIRITKHDATILFKLREKLAAALTSSTPRYRTVLAAELELAVKFYYPVNSSLDLYFNIGRLFMALKRYERATEVLWLSRSAFGSHYATYLNIAICYFHCKEFTQAFDAIQNSLLLKPSHKSSIEWHHRIELCLL